MTIQNNGTISMKKLLSNKPLPALPNLTSLPVGKGNNLNAHSTSATLRRHNNLSPFDEAINAVTNRLPKIKVTRRGPVGHSQVTSQVGQVGQVGSVGPVLPVGSTASDLSSNTCREIAQITNNKKDFTNREDDAMSTTESVTDEVLNRVLSNHGVGPLKKNNNKEGNCVGIENKSS